MARKVDRSAAAKRAAKTRASNIQIATGTARQAAWAAGPGEERMTSPLQPGGTEKLADMYHRLGFTDDAIHPAGQMELPGMESLRHARQAGLMPERQSSGSIADVGTRTLPDTPEPIPKWEDLPPKHQRRVLRRLAESGMTPETMKQSFGAQLDQAYVRAAGQGREPHAMRFYSDRSPAEDGEPMKPAERLVASARQNDVDLTTQALADSMTSPKQVFMHKPKSGPRAGQVTYPNDDMANIGVQGGKRIVEDPDFSHKDVVHPKGMAGMVGNTRRAAYAVGQRLSGKTLEELTSPGGTPAFGPKTRSYNNARVDPHSSVQRLTADVHTGGGGFAPHLNLESPKIYDHPTRKSVTVQPGEEPPAGRYRLRTDKKGKPASAISERESILSISGVHSLMDKVARDALAERGLQSLSGGQATQWGEERINRGLESEADAFPTRKQFNPRVEGQTKLFDVRTPTQAPAGEPVGVDRVRAEGADMVIQRNRRAKARRVQAAAQQGSDPTMDWINANRSQLLGR